MNNRVFDHILIIMLENQYRGYVLENPYMKGLAEKGIELCNFFGVMHPSQPNYIASIAGELCNVTNDARPKQLEQKTVVDLIENIQTNNNQTLSWRGYMDSYIADNSPWTDNDFIPDDHYPYVIKHNPFSSFKRILESQDAWQRIDSEAGLYRDLLNKTFPNYAWFSPNMWNDGHYLVGTTDNDLKGERAPVLVDQQAKWLESFFNGLRFPGKNTLLPDKTLVVVTYDEADFEAYYNMNKKSEYDGPNQIYTVLLGDNIIPAKQFEAYNHYSLLKTVEQNFDLGNLQKNDQFSNWFRFLWKERFIWKKPALLEGLQANDAGSENSNELAVCPFQNSLYCFWINAQQQINCARCQYNSMQSAIKCPDLSNNRIPRQLVCSANEKAFMLVVVDNHNALHCFNYSVETGWENKPIPHDLADHSKAVSLLSVPGTDDFMLASQSSSGAIATSRYQKGEWQSAQPVQSCQSNGQFTLASLGATLFLIYQRQDHKLYTLTYNTADYNQVEAVDYNQREPSNDTSINCWSPCSFPVKHFSQHASVLTPGEPEPEVETYTGRGQMFTATLDGVIHLIHKGMDSDCLVTETFSLSGMLTPVMPVSYDPNKKNTSSNGFGTLAQAGWSRPERFEWGEQYANHALAVCELDQHLYLIYQTDNKVYVSQGGYLKD